MTWEQLEQRKDITRLGEEITYLTGVTWTATETNNFWSISNGFRTSSPVDPESFITLLHLIKDAAQSCGRRVERLAQGD